MYNLNKKILLHFITNLIYSLYYKYITDNNKTF